MSTTTLEPFLVSELPPVTTLTLSRFESLRAHLTIRLAERRFERALRYASHAEYGDLLAASRRA